MEKNNIVIQFDYTEKQKKALSYLNDHKTSEVYFGGAAGGGKSFLGCSWLLDMCMRYPETTYFVARKRLTDLRRTTLRTFRKVCKSRDERLKEEFEKRGLTLPENIKWINQWEWKDKDHLLQFKNGSIIELVEAAYRPEDPDYDRLGSTEYTCGFMEEMGENVPREAFITLQGRIGRQNNIKYGIHPTILGTFNPTYSWVRNEIYEKWRNGSLPEGKVFIESFAADNTFNLSYVDVVSKMTGSRGERYRGNWNYDNNEDKLVKYDNILDLFTNTVDKNGEKYITCDVARFGADTTTIALWEDMELVELFIHNGESTTTTASRIKELAREKQVPYSHIVIDENGVGGGVIDQLQGVKGFINNSAPFITRKNDRTLLNNDSREIRENFASLKDQCYYHLAEYINNHKIALKVKEEQEDTITQELDACLRIDDLDNEGKQKIIRKERVKEIIGRSPDIADCIMMRMYFELNEVLSPVNTEDIWRIMANERRPQEYL